MEGNRPHRRGEPGSQQDAAFVSRMRGYQMMPLAAGSAGFRFAVYPRSLARRAGVLLVVLAWSSRGLGGGVHFGIQPYNGDLESAKALLKHNPDIVFTKDEFGATPLLSAAAYGRKDV